MKTQIKNLSVLPVLIAVIVMSALEAQTAVVFTSLYSFTGINDGANPNGLVQGRDGYFYGTTLLGGTNGIQRGGYGTVFKISTNGAMRSLHSFTGGNDGRNPSAGLVQCSDGYFYGTTGMGGTRDVGAVFKISTNGTLTSLYSFSGGNDGAYPTATLVQGSDGSFYGTTWAGGLFPSPGLGTVFKIGATGALTSLHSFGSVQDTNGLSLDGANPQAGLVQGGDGYFYGTTSEEGSNGWGTVFKICTNGALTILHTFGFADGGRPSAGLVQASDGNFYGTTGYGGGTNDDGTVYEISTNGAFTSLHPFTGGNDGANPYAELVLGADGYFYGTTFCNGWTLSFGGIAPVGSGTVFGINTNGTLTTFYSFTGANDGARPSAALVQGSDSSFYGTTSTGGTNGYGTVFRLTIVPEPPALTIIPSAANLILTWPTNAAGFNLQSTMNLVSPGWTTVSPAPVVVNGQSTVTNPNLGSQQFFRLISP